MIASGESLLDSLLRTQAELTAVERFAQRHADAERPLGAEHYAELIPVGGPGPGQQLAFRVDLDACTGCKACVTACHNLNGLDADETWRSVGLVVGDTPQPYQQTVTTACHHCADPACLAGCPVRAYEKDPTTGIVRHLDDQCIGCQYCVLKCPYDVPRYSEARGIVRKCDMCAGRLAQGEAPACVQGCPNGAISIQVVDAQTPPAPLVPGVAAGVPPSGYTRPTTRYVTGRSPGGLRPANQSEPQAARPHRPLAIMLVLLQLSVGALIWDVLLGGAPWLLDFAALSGALGLGVATTHLGRPLYAFRAVLGWRTSWMSREVLALGAYVPLAAAAAWLAPQLRLPALAVGLVACACSAMIYIDTRRALWSLERTAVRFAFSAWILGASLAGTTLLIVGERGGAGALALLAGVLGIALKLRLERRFVKRAQRGDDVALRRSAQLLAGELRPWAAARLALGVVAVGCALLALAVGPMPFAPLALGGLLASELVERDLFFRAEATPAMPGM